MEMAVRPCLELNFVQRNWVFSKSEHKFVSLGLALSRLRIIPPGCFPHRHCSLHRSFHPRIQMSVYVLEQEVPYRMFKILQTSSLGIHGNVRLHKDIHLSSQQTCFPAKGEPGSACQCYYCILPYFRFAWWLIVLEILPHSFYAFVFIKPIWGPPGDFTVINGKTEAQRPECTFWRWELVAKPVLEARFPDSWFSGNSIAPGHPLQA